MHIFELGMLICFGVSWPISILKTYRSRTTKGKSVIFSVIIQLGYICGIINKILNGTDFVLYLYIFNLLMVFTDMMLWFRNRRLERAEEGREAE